MTYEDILREYEKIRADYNAARIPIMNLLITRDALDMYIVELKKLIVDQHNKAKIGTQDDSLLLMSMIASLTDLAIFSGNIHGFSNGVTFVVARSSVPTNHLN